MAKRIKDVDAFILKYKEKHKMSEYAILDIVEETDKKVVIARIDGCATYHVPKTELEDIL